MAGINIKLYMKGLSRYITESYGDTYTRTLYTKDGCQVTFRYTGCEDESSAKKTAYLLSAGKVKKYMDRLIDMFDVTELTVTRLDDGIRLNGTCRYVLGGSFQLTMTVGISYTCDDYDLGSGRHGSGEYDNTPRPGVMGHPDRHPVEFTRAFTDGIDAFTAHYRPLIKEPDTLKKSVWEVMISADPHKLLKDGCDGICKGDPNWSYELHDDTLVMTHAYKGSVDRTGERDLYMNLATMRDEDGIRYSDIKKINK